MSSGYNRRQFLQTATVAVTGGALVPRLLAASGAPRRLRLYHTHTGESLEVIYHETGIYLPDALEELNDLLRDFRTGERIDIDPALFDLLHTVQRRLGSTGTYGVISAYRSPATNHMLRRRGAGVAKRSLHMQGKAIDVRLSDVNTRDLRLAALDVARGGVGYYASADFVHLDTGRVRWW